MKFIFSLMAIVIFTFFNACKNKDLKRPPPPPLVKKETVLNNKVETPQKGPIINIVDTVEVKRIVLCVKDSSSTSAGLSAKLSNIYNSKLPAAISAGKMKTAGLPIAWYKTQKAPFFFEVGLPIDKIPLKMPKGFFVKKTEGDSALVAHFFGPTVMTNTAYEALFEMLKNRKKKKSTPSYEIYIDNPFEVKKGKIDLYKQQTDIVLPYK